MARNLTSNHSDFPSDQAAILQDLARNGAADEASMYGYTSMASNVQSNGAAPSQEYSFSDAYPTTALSNSYQDMDDPAALLESLAAFEHPAGNNARNAVSNDHFASLLQAAATAGGAEIAHAEGNEHDNGGQTGQSDAYGFFRRTFDPEPRPKRKRAARGLSNGEVNAEDDRRSHSLSPNKRRKKTPLPEDPDQLAREREIWGSEEDEAEDDNVSVSEHSFQHIPISTANARKIGVHSAAALFRRPSAASKKYARKFRPSSCEVELTPPIGAPMSRLFTSLELDPEIFLEMQNAAKIYMLDPNHPERRQETVGSKGKRDPDMVKLRLFATVRAFLEDENWGEKCFGTSAEGGTKRKLKWPTDASK